MIEQGDVPQEFLERADKLLLSMRNCPSGDVHRIQWAMYTLIDEVYRGGYFEARDDSDR